MQQQDLIHPLSETAKMHKTMIFLKENGHWTMKKRLKAQKLTTTRPRVEKGHAVKVRHVPSVEQN